MKKTISVIAILILCSCAYNNESLPTEISDCEQFAINKVRESGKYETEYSSPLGGYKVYLWFASTKDRRVTSDVVTGIDMEREMAYTRKRLFRDAVTTVKNDCIASTKKFTETVTEEDTTRSFR